MEIKKMKAVVKWYDAERRGYGFAYCPELKDDVFIHANDINDDVKLKEGDNIIMEIREGKKGFQGRHIELVQ